MFPADDDKNLILQNLCCGESCVVESGPGTGKTWFILNAAAIDDRPVLVLAYNRLLMLQLQTLLPLNAVCFTFHSLCSTYLAPARDDEQLAEVVEAAQRGEIRSKFNDAKFSRVCIDEAQDVRSHYVALLGACGLVDAKTTYLIAGDRQQLIYDFDPDFPASLEFMLSPSKLLAGVKEWRRHSLTISHRLSSNICDVVNHIFETKLQSAREDNAKIDVRVPKSVWKSFESIEDVLREEKSVLLLTTERRNRSLCTLLSTVSQAGFNVAVHHFDDDQTDGFDGVRAGTYWSAKGVESRCVIAMMDARSARNATYVALTRASRRLVILLDPDAPNAAIASAIEAYPAAFDVRGHSGALRSAALSVATALTPKPRYVPPNGFQHVGRARASRAALADAGVRRTPVEVAAAALPGSEQQAPEDDKCETLKGSLMRAALFLAEFKSTGSVRWLRDILDPVVMPKHSVDEAIRLGFARRTVAPRTPLEKLLAPDLLAVVRGIENEALRSSQLTLESALLLALASFAFNGFDHSMRMHLDAVDALAAEYGEDVDWVVGELLKKAYGYDVPLVNGEQWLRVDAKNDDECALIVWAETTNSDQANAAIRASLHPRRACRVFSLRERRVELVTVERELILD